MRSEEEARRTMDLYGDMVKRICFLHLKNDVDTEDIFQTVFLKYVLYSGIFENGEHEKAWFARVTMNACRDLLKSFYKKKVIPISYISDTLVNQPEEGAPSENSRVLEAVLELPIKYRQVVYLFYYEGYSAVRIAKILHKNENTVYTNLSRAKKLLKQRLGGEALGQ